MQKGFAIEDDILLTHKGSVGNVSVVPQLETDYIMLTPQVTYYRVLDHDRLSRDYLKFYFGSPKFQRDLVLYSGGGTRAYIGITAQRKLDVLLPTIQEQRKIAEILSTWDKAIRLTQELIASKEQRKKGLMQRLLTGQVRFAGFGERPWDEVKLGQVFKERRERGFDHLPLLSITGEDGIVYRDELVRRDTSNADKSKYLRICHGDIGYNTMRMWQGVSAVSTLEGIVSPAYTICIPKTEKVDVTFMGYLFKFKPTIYKFWRYSQGLVSDTLNLKFINFAEIKVTIPELNEQRRIATVLQACDQEIQLLQQKLAALQQQKKGLMQRLLTGQVRVPQVPGKGREHL